MSDDVTNRKKNVFSSKKILKMKIIESEMCVF